MSRLLTVLRGLADRLHHARRRRAALDALSGRPRPRFILVVCHGNLCRSPFAAAALERALGGTGIRVASAGFAGSDRPVPAAALNAAARRGVDLSAHRSRPLWAEQIRAADLVIVMDPAQERALRAGFARQGRDVIVLGDLDPVPAWSRAIPDPVSQSDDVYERVYARLERCVTALAEAVAVSGRQNGATPEPESS